VASTRAEQVSGQLYNKSTSNLQQIEVMEFALKSYITMKTNVSFVVDPQKEFSV